MKLSAKVARNSAIPDTFLKILAGATACAGVESVQKGVTAT